MLARQRENRFDLAQIEKQMSDAPQTSFSDAERLARLRLIRAGSIGPSTFWALIERFGSADHAIGALPALARKSAKARPIMLPSLDETEREIDATTKRGGKSVLS